VQFAKAFLLRRLCGSAEGAASPDNTTDRCTDTVYTPADDSQSNVCANTPAEQ
jgi:hypothetical protein